MDVLDDLRAAVHRDPRDVADRASRIACEARLAGDLARAGRALAVLGRARRSLGEIDLAESDLLAAVDAGRSVADAELVADAQIGLAGVLSFAGRSDEAFALLDEAAAHGTERALAYAALQRAIIAQRLGRLAEALAGYDAALPTLRDLDARVDQALVLMNRGVIRTQTGETAAAIADLAASGDLFAGLHDDFGVAQTRHGLGFAHARAGDVPRALGLLDDAHDRFALLGHDAPEVDVDRIEVLLAAGLSADATELAAELAAQLHAAGNHSWAAEVWLLAARAAQLEGDDVAARLAAARARDLFAEQGADAWERAARLELLRSGAPDAADPRRLADDLSADGNAVGATSALALAAVAAARRAPQEAADLAAECERRAQRLGLFEVRMQAAHAVASCAAERGDSALALRRIAAALTDLRLHRAGLAASGARAAVAGHARALVELGLRLAADSGSPRELLGWIEQARAGRAWFVAPRPPADAQLAADLGELRSVAAALRGHDGDTGDLLARQAALERSVQRRLLRTASDGNHDPSAGFDPARLRERLDDAVLVELVVVGDRLRGVAVTRNGERFVDAGAIADVRRCVAALRSALASAARLGRSPTGDGLLPRLFAALEALVHDAVVGTGPLVVVVPPELHVVPWHLLPGLRGRPVVVAPSATWWVDAPDRPASLSRAVLVAGPRLDEAEREVLGIARGYDGATVLTGPAAQSAAVVDAFATADVAHVASHGRIRHDNALWSSLELADGPLYVHDLERAARTPPLVALSGCDTGVGVRAGDQLLGLAAAFLDRGTRSLVAGVCPLPDTPATAAAMIALHAELARAADPSAALAALAADDEHRFTASCLSCFGAS